MPGSEDQRDVPNSVAFGSLSLWEYKRVYIN